MLKRGCPIEAQSQSKNLNLLDSSHPSIKILSSRRWLWMKSSTIDQSTRLASAAHLELPLCYRSTPVLDLLYARFCRLARSFIIYWGIDILLESGQSHLGWAICSPYPQSRLGHQSRGHLRQDGGYGSVIRKWWREAVICTTLNVFEVTKASASTSSWMHLVALQWQPSLTMAHEIRSHSSARNDTLAWGHDPFLLLSE